MAVKKIKSVEELEKKISTCSSCLEKKFNGKDGKRHIVVCGGTGCLSSDSQGIIDKLNSLIKEKKLEENPNDADITSNLGAIMQKQGKMDEALTYYRKAEYINPSNINTRLNVGTLYQQKGDYTSHATELNLSAGSKFEVSAGSYTLADGATVKVSGLGSSITAQTIKLNSGSTLYFQLDQSVYDNKPENAMLKLNQTDNSAQAISLKDVTVTVDAATTTAAKRRAARTGTTETVHLLHSNKGFTDIPADSAANNLYQVKVTDGETYRYGEDTTPDPDPDTGGTDPGQGGTNPGEGTTPPGSGGDGSGGDSLVAVRDPLGLARLGATGNQARAFTIIENGTFAAD